MRTYTLFLIVFFFCFENILLAEDPPATGSIGPLKYERTPGTASAFLPDISVIGAFTGAFYTTDPGPNGHNPERTGLNLQEIELGLQSAIDPYVKADIFLAFHEHGVELEEGYVTSLSLPYRLQIRGGKMKLPFGRFNPKHLEKWSFVNDTLVNNTIFGEEGFNEIAVNPSILLPLPFYLKIEASFSNGDNENNFDGGRKQDFAYSGRISASQDFGHLTALIGVSSAFGFNNTGPGNFTEIFGGDLTFRWLPKTNRGLSWENEFIYRQREIPGTTETEGGFYSQLTAQWSKRWQAGVRFDFLGLPKNNEEHWRNSVMLHFMPSEFLSFRLQYDIEDSDISSKVQAAFLQMIFSFGPHGAHQF